MNLQSILCRMQIHSWTNGVVLKERHNPHSGVYLARACPECETYEVEIDGEWQKLVWSERFLLLPHPLLK